MKHTINEVALWKAINKWEKTVPIELLLDFQALSRHMRSEYGIQFNSAFVSPEHTIVDETKYTMFLLRFS